MVSPTRTGTASARIVTRTNGSQNVTVPTNTAFCVIIIGGGYPAQTISAVTLGGESATQVEPADVTGTGSIDASGNAYGVYVWTVANNGTGVQSLSVTASGNVDEGVSAQCYFYQTGASINDVDCAAWENTSNAQVTVDSSSDDEVIVAGTQYYTGGTLDLDYNDDHPVTDVIAIDEGDEADQSELVDFASGTLDTVGASTSDAHASGYFCAFGAISVEQAAAGGGFTSGLPLLGVG